MLKSREKIIHYLMIFNGGLMGGYAMLLRDNFGSAMTGNMMQLFVDISLHDLSMVTSRLGALVIYAASFMLSSYFKNHTKVKMRRLSPFVIMAGMLIAASIPVSEEIDPIIALYPIFFISAFQWNSFGGTKEYASSTIFISNNTRQSANAWSEYLATRDAEYKKRAIFYTLSVLFFCAGVFMDCLLSIRIKQYAILIGIIPVLITEFLVRGEDGQAKKTHQF